MIAPIKKNAKVTQRLANLSEEVIGDIKAQRSPGVDIPLRNLANVRFNPKKAIIEMGKAKQTREFFNIGMARKFMQTFLVAEKCKSVLDEGKTTSIRDLYYMAKGEIPGTNENTFEEQIESDPIIEDLEVTADSLR